MVTGVETAGFVLAAFPLVISALEHYKEGFSTIQVWWMYRPEFLDFLRKIGIQSVLFRGNLEELLAPIVTSDAHMNELLNAPGGLAWQDKLLEDRLRQRLPKSYDWYCLTIEDMQRDMERLKRKLNIKDGKLPRLSDEPFPSVKDWWKQEFSRVSFALNKKTRARLLKQLEKHNDNLEKLLCSSDRIASSQSRRPSQVPSKLRNIYKQARGLSSALKKGWQCSCQHYHSSNILLEDRTSSSPPARRSSLVSDSISLQFAILFHYGQVPAPWIWHEVEIKVSQAEATLPVLPTSPTLASSTLSPSSTFSSGAVTLRSTKSSATSKQLRFDLSGKSKLPNPTEQDLIEISSLCQAIQAVNKGIECMGFLRDDNEYQYAFYPVDKGHESIDYSNVMTLDSLLDRLNNKAPLSRRQRFHIAVLLSVSVLQLFSTPWLTDLWNKEKVLLLWTEDDSTDQTGANQVYVKADPISQISSSTDSTKVIFALGVMLLELCFGQKLEEHPNWDKYLGADGKANEHTEFATAREWQAKVTPEAGPEFAEAVRKCLLCAFATKGTSLEDDDFRNAFYTGVVRPVQDYWRFGYGNASLETY